MSTSSGINEKKILMICYYYPPLSDVGSQRSASFSKYLKKHGWRPFVLTIKNPDKNFCTMGTDAPPDGIDVQHAYSIFNVFWLVKIVHGLMAKAYALARRKELQRNYVYEILAIPDLFWGWIFHSILKGRSIVRSERIDIIYVSCSPFSAAIIGVCLKILTGKKLVLDFRDPFALKSISFYKKNKFSRMVNESLENWFLKHADMLVLTTEETRQAYNEQYPRFASKTFTVHNGIDRELLPENISKYDKFTMMYGGNLYFFALNNRCIFEALAMLKKRGAITRDSFQFLYYGVDKRQVENLAREWDVEDLVIARGGIPHWQLLGALSKSHVQLLRIIKPMISTKLFEGIALNTPFLAVIPPGEVHDIITRYSPASLVVNEESAVTISGAIQAIMDSYGKKTTVDNRLAEFMAAFSRENLTLKLKSLMGNHLS